MPEEKTTGHEKRRAIVKVRRMLYRACVRVPPKTKFVNDTEAGRA